MASEACVEPTKTMMMPITREQPHAASARISLYTGMGSGGRLCTSPSFHSIADPSRLSVSTASSPSRFAIRIRGLWAKAITVPRALSRRQLSASPAKPANASGPVNTHQDTRIPMSLEFSYRVLHTAVHGLAPHKVFYPAQVWWKPWEAGEIGMRAAAGSALGQSLGKRPPVSSIMLSFASCGTKTVEASFGVGATR